MSDCTCILLRTVSRKVTALYDAVLAPFGINIAQFGLLHRIREAGSPSLTELGRLSELDRSTVGRNVRVLEKLGLVRLETGLDQREASVGLSESGEALLLDCAPRWSEAQHTIDARIGPEAVAVLRAAAGDL